MALTPEEQNELLGLLGKYNMLPEPGKLEAMQQSLAPAEQPAFDLATDGPIVEQALQSLQTGAPMPKDSSGLNQELLAPSPGLRLLDSLKAMPLQMSPTVNETVNPGDVLDTVGGKFTTGAQGVPMDVRMPTQALMGDKSLEYLRRTGFDARLSDQGNPVVKTPQGWSGMEDTGYRVGPDGRAYPSDSPMLQNMPQIETPQSASMGVRGKLSNQIGELGADTLEAASGALTPALVTAMATAPVPGMGTWGSASGALPFTASRKLLEGAKFYGKPVASNVGKGGVAGFLSGAIKDYGRRFLGMDTDLNQVANEVAVGAVEGGAQSGLSMLLNTLTRTGAAAPMADEVKDQLLREGRAEIAAGLRVSEQEFDPYVARTFYDNLQKLENKTGIMKRSIVTEETTKGWGPASAKRLAANIQKEEAYVGNQLRAAEKEISALPESSFKASELQDVADLNRAKLLSQQGDINPDLDAIISIEGETAARTYTQRLDKFVQPYKAAYQAKIDETQPIADTVIKKMDEISATVKELEEEKAAALVKREAMKAGSKSKKAVALDNQIAGYDDLITKSKAELEQTQDTMIKISNYLAALREEAADPTLSFEAVQGFKRTLQGAANDAFSVPTKDVAPEARALKYFSGAVRDAVGNKAATAAEMAGRGELARKFVNLNETSHLLSYAKQTTKRGISAAISELPESMRRSGVSLSPSNIAAFRPGSQGWDALTARTIVKNSTYQQSPSEMFVEGVLKTERAKMGGATPEEIFLQGQQRAAGVIGSDLGLKESRSPKLPPEAIENKLVLQMLYREGWIGDAELKSGVSEDQLPPDVVLTELPKMKEAAKMAVQPYLDAHTFGDAQGRGMALSKLTKQFPEIFPKPKTGMNGEVDDGKALWLFDLQDQVVYSSAVQNSKLDWNDKSKIVSELFGTGRVQSANGKIFKVD
mgnify:CR=1 FL=1